MLGSAQIPFVSSIDRWTRKNHAGSARPNAVPVGILTRPALYSDQVTVILADLPCKTRRDSYAGVWAALSHEAIGAQERALLSVGAAGMDERVNASDVRIRLMRFKPFPELGH